MLGQLAYTVYFSAEGDILTCCEHSWEGLLIPAWYILLSGTRHAGDAILEDVCKKQDLVKIQSSKVLDS